MIKKINLKFFVLATTLFSLSAPAYADVYFPPPTMFDVAKNDLFSLGIFIFLLLSLCFLVINSVKLNRENKLNNQTQSNQNTLIFLVILGIIFVFALFYADYKKAVSNYNTPEPECMKTASCPKY